MKKLLRNIIILSLLLLPLTAFAGEITDFVVSPSPASAGVLSGYNIQFDISSNDMVKLRNGIIEIDFPEGIDISAISSINFDDSFNYLMPDGLIWAITGQRLTIELKKNVDISYVSKLPDDSLVTVAIIINGIVNPRLVGQYTVSLTGMKVNRMNISGPKLSRPFSIIPGNIFSLKLYPVGPQTIQAGRTITFNAESFDRYGNIVTEPIYDWSLVECVDCIGTLEGSVLLSTTTGVGQIIVSAGTIADTSALITVIPGDLNRMVLEVGETQFVGHPLVEQAALSLNDSYGNLKTDYDIEAFPIDLFVEQGEINPSNISSSNYFSGGVVDLLSANITYTGQSGQFDFYTAQEFIESNSNLLSFNQYDILGLNNLLGDSLQTIFAGLQTYVEIPLINNGNLVALDELVISTMYKSQMNDTLISTNFVFMTPPVPGTEESVQLVLPGLETTALADTLIVTVSANFSFNDSIYNVTNSRHFPLVVLQTTQIYSYVQRSFEPDTILAQQPFDFNFMINTHVSQDPIDSVRLRLILEDVENGQLAVVYDDIVQTENPIDSIYILSGTDAFIDTMDFIGPNGEYPLNFEFQLYSTDNNFSFAIPGLDTIYILFDLGVTYEDGSFSPTQLFSSTDAQFSFNLNSESGKQFIFLPEISSISVYDSTFSSTTRLFTANDTLAVGTNTFTSNVLSFQSLLIGTGLHAKAELKFLINGVNDTLNFDIYFKDVIEVLTQPSIQIIDVIVEAPNSPRVNMLQPIRVKCIVTNTCYNPAHDVEFQLVSVNGTSYIKDPIQSLGVITPDDTTEFYFEVIASDQANDIPEIFRLDIISDFVLEDEPINNSAYLFIDVPAELGLTYRLNGIENSGDLLLDYGEAINFNILLNNFGTAKTIPGNYRFIISGHNTQQPDTIYGSAPVDSTFSFSYRAPQFDTTVNITFEIIEVPIDINFNQSAYFVSDTVISLNLIVLSSDAELVAESDVIGNNLALPGRIKEVFKLTLTNSAVTEISSVSLEDIEIFASTSGGENVVIYDIFVITNSGFYDGDTKVASASSGESKLFMIFDNYIIQPGETKELVFMAEFISSSQGPITIKLNNENVHALFSSGPNTGLPVLVSSASGNSQLLETQIIIKSSGLNGSFMIADNPFNPELAPAELAYELVGDADIEFRIFTLSGELVLEKYFSAGTTGGSNGENIIYWNGNNDEGTMILDGIYVATITNNRTNETVHLKIAVVK